MAERRSGVPRRKPNVGDVPEALVLARFKRAHRSSILNLDRVVRLEPPFHGEFVAVLRGGTRVPVSRSYSAWVRELA